MPKLRVLSGAEICRILAANGFSEKRQRGSHVVMQRREGDTTRSVPVPMHTEVAIGTLRSIIRQSGLPTGPFEQPN